MRTTLLNFLLLTTVYASAQTLPQTFKMEDAPRYSEATGYGYDRTETPAKGSKEPFYFSVRVPDGNYLVTVFRQQQTCSQYNRPRRITQIVY